MKEIDSKKVIKGGKRKRKREGERHLIMYNDMNILKHNEIIGLIIFHLLFPVKNLMKS